MSRARPAAAMTLLIGLAACGFLPRAMPAWVGDREPLPACGQEDVGHGEGYDVAARRCLLDAYHEGRGAELISTLTSVEGDDITRYTRAYDDGSVEVIVDATADRFGSGAWERLSCERILTVDEAEAPGLTFPDEMVFVEDGCEPVGIP